MAARPGDPSLFEGMDRRVKPGDDGVLLDTPRRPFAAVFVAADSAI
jgi:hypothetical protein